MNEITPADVIQWQNIIQEKAQTKYLSKFSDNQIH